MYHDSFPFSGAVQDIQKRQQQRAAERGQAKNGCETPTVFFEKEPLAVAHAPAVSVPSPDDIDRPPSTTERLRANFIGGDY